MAVAAVQPLPTSTSGHKVALVAGGLRTPTSFAFGEGRIFAADGGGQDTPARGGVFVLEHGRARRLAGSPAVALGLAWRSGTLYVSSLTKLLAMSGWDGTNFARTRILYSGPRGFTGFNGLGFGADGRLYTGVYLGETNDHNATSAPHAFDVLSFNAAGEDLKIVARGLRQPFQLAFPAGSSSPFVSVLGQDLPPGINPPDYIVRVHVGEDYGFPTCNWLVRTACRRFTRPFRFLPPHASPMGLGIIGTRLYIALYGAGANSHAQVVSMSLSGGTIKPVVSGFVAPIVALSTYGGSVYVGELTGRVFRFRP